MSSWSAWALGRGFAFCVYVTSVVGVGCASETTTAAEATGSGSYSGVGGTSGAAPQQPMLVVVDPNRVMNATPGQGVGVFTEYQTGGHWRVWWTCDTSKTGEPCYFNVIASLAPGDGTITNTAGISLQSGDALSQDTPQSVRASTTTTATIEGMTFDTPLGATITLDASLGGLKDGSFLFFVQDGKINGGYAGTLTDPLELQPSAN
jgi:hypothetical protein